MANINQQQKIRALCVGLEPPVQELLKNPLAPCQVISLPFHIEQLMEPLDPPPQLILCGPAASGVSVVEIGQMISMQYKGVPFFFVALDRTGYDRKLFVKNGFTDAFILPIDGEILKKMLAEYFSKLTNGEIKSYRSVKLLDIEPGVVLGFDTTIFLPSNNRYIKYASAGDPIDEARLEKLNRHKMSAVYVSTDQMDKFYQFTASRLREMGSSSKYSATEKREKTEAAVRDLVSGLFNESTKSATFEEGGALLKDCREIVNSFVTDSPTGDWYKRLLSTMGEMGSSYGHAANVSTYAALFSIGLQMCDPADVATAGLLHDIGFADIPLEVVSKDESLRTKEEQALYEKHPEYTINILKKRKVALSAPISTAILQHHEKFNGTGYPHGLAGNRISKEAQILALADKFDELTTAAEGRPLMTPKEAVEYFKKEMDREKGQMIFDPELLKKMIKLFPA